jgi:ATP-binding cassette subfamily F protein 3
VVVDKSTAEASSAGKLSYEQKKEQEKLLRKLRKAVESVEEELAKVEAEIAAYDKRFAEATEYNADDYAKYDALKQRYDQLMHEWEKASYELEITEQN